SITTDISNYYEYAGDDPTGAVDALGLQESTGVNEVQRDVDIQLGEDIVGKYQIDASYTATAPLARGKYNDPAGKVGVVIHLEDKKKGQGCCNTKGERVWMSFGNVAYWRASGGLEQFMKNKNPEGWFVDFMENPKEPGVPIPTDKMD